MEQSNPAPNHSNAGSTPEDVDNETTKQKVEEDTQDAKRKVGDKAREKAEAGQHRLADETNNLSDAIDAAASNLDDHDREGLARYARELSGHLTDAAGQIEGRSVDELANDAKRLARNNPAMFMLGSIAVGFGLSRFFKASTERDHNDSADQTDTDPNSENVQDYDVSTGMPMQELETNMSETKTASPAQHNTQGRDNS